MSQSGETRTVYITLLVLFGWCGAHHFYLRRHVFACVYLVSFGLFGVGWIFDFMRINSLLSDYEEKKRPSRKEAILRHDDMRILTTLLGFTGIQHFILKRYICGVYYLLTLGGLGCGWVTDVFRIHLLTEQYNLQRCQYSKYHDGYYRLSDAYIYCIPFGFLGLHHFYLSRPRWGVFYLLTFGNFGIGWLIDIIRLKKLMKQDPHKWSAADAFILWFPLGIFGAHWLYLNQRLRALAYCLTLGYSGIGWIIDLRRIPVHVRSLNRKFMLAGIIHAEDIDSLQWDDSDYRAALLPSSRGPSRPKVTLTRMTSRNVCLRCGGPGVCVMPCTHFSLCQECVQKASNCPRCFTDINGWATVDI